MIICYFLGGFIIFLLVIDINNLDAFFNRVYGENFVEKDKFYFGDIYTLEN